RRERVQEPRPLARQPIHVRRLDEGMAGGAELVPAHVVDQHEDDVGRPRRPGRRCPLHGASGEDRGDRREQKTELSRAWHESGIVAGPLRVSNHWPTARRRPKLGIMPTVVGTAILHYRLLERLGEGGMGEVYLVEDTRLQRRAALKLISPSLTRDEE